MTHSKQVSSPLFPPNETRAFFSHFFPRAPIWFRRINWFSFIIFLKVKFVCLELKMKKMTLKITQNYVRFTFFFKWKWKTNKKKRIEESLWTKISLAGGYMIPLLGTQKTICERVFFVRFLCTCFLCVHCVFVCFCPGIFFCITQNWGYFEKNIFFTKYYY